MSAVSTDSSENAALRARIAQLEAVLTANRIAVPPPPATSTATAIASAVTTTPATAVDHKQSASQPAGNSKLPPPPVQAIKTHSLSNSEIVRYSRQLLLPEVGVTVQSRWASSRVLVIGAGGLGAPVALYLAAAGVGTLGLVDADTVAIDNLHRQIIHSEQTIGVHKVVSARDACLRLNSTIKVVAHAQLFDESNAIALASAYDILVDASDNVATRYLINDAAILTKKPLVSGSALRMEGQVTVYGYGSTGPCYRCLYPKPPPPETVTNCSDGGVLGVICGIIGCVQALEVLKIAGGMCAPEPNTTATGAGAAATGGNASVLSSKLLLFDGETTRFRTVALRGRQPDCAVCGTKPTITRDGVTAGASSSAYATFCRSAMHDKTVTAIDDLKALNHAANFSVTTRQYAALLRESQAPLSQASSPPPPPHVLLDVREPVQFGIGSLPGAINIPLKQLSSRLNELNSAVDAVASASAPPSSATGDAARVPIFVVCRRGVDSITATSILRQHAASAAATTTTAPSSSAAPFSVALNSVITSAAPVTTATARGAAAVLTPRVSTIQNVQGGYQSWAVNVDPNFPIY